MDATDVEFTKEPRINDFELESVEDADARIEAILSTLEDVGLLEDDKPSLLDFLLEDGRFESLSAALFGAGPELINSLSELNSFTLFAPSEMAFEKLGADAFNALFDDQETLINLLSYHVLPSEQGSADLLEESLVETLQGQGITLDATDEVLFLNDNVKAVEIDIEVVGGVVHVIDTVLMPSDAPTIAEIVATDENFETLLAALQAADLVDVFTGAGDFTVFAPTDEAFAALQPGVLDTLLADPNGTLAEILTYHAVGQSLSSDELAGLNSVTTLQGEGINIELIDGDIVLNGSVNVSVANVEASNGIVHVINAVLVPPEPTATIADIVAANESLARLNALLEATGLDEALQGGEFTLFAPQNFLLFTPHLTDVLLRFAPQIVTDLLSNHVVEGRFEAATLLSGESVTTLSGRELTLASTDDGIDVSIDRGLFTPQVVEADIQAANGVVHIIDVVLA